MTERRHDIQSKLPDLSEVGFSDLQGLSGPDIAVAVEAAEKKFDDGPAATISGYNPQRLDDEAPPDSNETNNAAAHNSEPTSTRQSSVAGALGEVVIADTTEVL